MAKGETSARKRSAERGSRGARRRQIRFTVLVVGLFASGLLAARKCAAAERNAPQDADLADYVVHSGLVKEENLPLVLTLKHTPVSHGASVLTGWL